MSNETDNVLVNREQYEAMKEFILALFNSHVNWDLFDPRTMGRDINERLKEILDMPDFIPSEQDVEVTHHAIKVGYQGYPQSDMPEAQAAINALRINGE